MKFSFCAFLFVSAAVLITAQEAKDDEYDGFAVDYDDFYNYDQLKEEGEKIELELDKLNAESDLKVKSEIDNFKEENVDFVEGDKDEDGIVIDYQVEDNRDKPKEDKEIDNFKEENVDFDEGDKDENGIIIDYQVEDNRDKPKEDKKEIPANIDVGLVADDAIDAPIDNDDDKKKHDDQADYALLWGDDSIAPLPVPDAELTSENKDILDETQRILKNETDGFEEEINKAIANFESFSNNKPGDEIIDETKKILEETGDAFNDNDEIKTDDVIDESKKVLEENNDLLNNADDKLSNESQIEDEPKSAIKDNIPIEKAVEDVPIENIAGEVDGKDLEIFVKENKTSSNIEHKVIVDEEDTVDKVYSDLNEDLDKLLETLDKLSDNGADGDEKLEEVFDKLDDHFFKEDDNDIEGSEELDDDLKENDEYSEVGFDKILEDINNENDLKLNDSPNIDLNVPLNDEMNEPNPDDAFESDVEALPEVDAEPILYLDAIVDEPKNAESVESTNSNNTAVIDASVEAKELSTEKPTEKRIKANTTDTVDIDTLNSEQLEDLVKQFSVANNDLLDVESEVFDQNVAPIHIKLNLDNPEIVTSPNYPSAYPTNNIVDWIFEGEGIGIEMNITDFSVNGALGDYLLVKPGGIDESGHEGILFTYRLNSEKRFRFTDVDRLFVRFESKRGLMNLMRGFQFSVKMIAPIPDEPEPIPEPEPVVDPPHSRHTIHLAVAITQFYNATFRESFRLLLADMAEQFIQDNHIDPGLNTTAEITQITLISVCLMSWPDYELCTAVTYGVSLVYPDLETPAMLDNSTLQDMWKTYSIRDPYALRLSRMGIAEFEQPSSSVLTVWLVIGSGVVISMVMLAFVLWRFSCFEDYTRMKTYSDTDSMQSEKRGLDLYPTPHQTLPPLYADTEYKWPEGDDTARVDIGGFANKSYARDMYDFDSDEEVITPREVRTGAVTARDIYSGSVA